MKIFGKKIIAAALATAFAVAPVAHAQETKKDLIPINIGLPISNYWPAYIARDLGLFEKAGLDPKFYMFQSGAPLIAGMKSGSLDIAWTGLATLFMLGQRIPLKFVLVPLDSSSQMAYVVNPKSGIESYKDIGKSKNIAAPTATCAEVSMVMAAKRAGLDLKSIKSSNLAPNLIQKALDDGQVDSTFMWGPWNMQWRNAGYKIVNHDKDYMDNGGVCATTVAIRPTYLEQNPTVGCRLIQVHAWALEAARKDPDHAIRTMQEAFNISPELAKETYETLIIPTIESQVEADSPWSLSNKSAGLTEKLYQAGQALLEAKSIHVNIDRNTISESVDDTYLRNYLDDKSCT